VVALPRRDNSSANLPQDCLQASLSPIAERVGQFGGHAMCNVLFAIVCGLIALFASLQSRPHPSEYDFTKQIDADDSQYDRRNRTGS
jgi:hypothetical protein